MNQILERAARFAESLGLPSPVLLAPMAGASPTALSIAVMRAGGLGACGCLLMSPEDIATWAHEVRTQTGTNKFNVNLWIPDPPPTRDPEHEARVRHFLGQWGPPVPEAAGDARPPDFLAQSEALLQAEPAVISSVMGLYSPDYVARLKDHGTRYFAVVTTVAEARAAKAAGADAIVAQGAEAGGHRGSFDAATAERQLVGLFSLLPAVVDAVGPLPVIATGGIADARGVAAALLLGASAVQVGTAFLRSPESGIHPAWADALAHTAPEDTIVTRAFSGRAGRSVANRYALSAASTEAPVTAPYPVQRALTAPMRAEALKDGDVQRMQAWAGQSAALGPTEPAGDLLRRMWDEALALLA